MQGYEKLGFRREGNTVVYREWCPAATSAQLIGDFNGWGGTHMEKDGLGVWKAVLPDGDCLPPSASACTLVARRMPSSAGRSQACKAHASQIPGQPVLQDLIFTSLQRTLLLLTKSANTHTLWEQQR